MLVRDMPFNIPLTIGMIIVIAQMSVSITSSSESAARNQSGAFFPLMRIFCINPMTGFAINDTTTAMRTYTMTLLKYQQIAPIIAIPAARRIYLASLSTYLSECSILPGV